MKHSYFCLGCLVILSAAACKQDREIKVYRVARETAQGAAEQPAPAADPHAARPGGAPNDPHAGLPAEPQAGSGSNNVADFADRPPARWKKQALSSMRLASYLIEGEGGTVADVSFATLRRATGGVLANANRWREQLGQPAIDDAALKQSAQTINTCFGEGIVVDIEGPVADTDAVKDGRIVGVIAQTDHEAWFFKMRGNAALVAGAKEDFFKWVGSVKPAAPGTPAAPPTAGLADPPPAADNRVTWQLPEGWKLAPAAGSMRYATINISATDGTTAELAVTHFPGAVGGDLDNVNRWRQQVAMEPLDAAGLAPLITQLSAGPQSISMIDITGSKLRLIAGWTRHGPDTWFFKLTGSNSLVGAQKASFTAFLASIRFNHPE